MTRDVTLTDDDDGIDIAKSGAPEPSAAMLEWLVAECRGSWRFECDHVFNVSFHFAEADDAARFKARWSGGRGV